MRHPLEKERVCDVGVGIASLLLLGASLTWALIPIADPILPIEAASVPGSVTGAAAKARAPLDVEPFRAAQLWPLLNLPEPVAEPATPPADLRLLGIDRSNGRLRAALYDVGQDRLVNLGLEESHGDVRITGITDTEIAFERRGQVGTWRLVNGPRSLQGDTR